MFEIKHNGKEVIIVDDFGGGSSYSIEDCQYILMNLRPVVEDLLISQLKAKEENHRKEIEKMKEQLNAIQITKQSSRVHASDS